VFGRTFYAVLMITSWRRGAPGRFWVVERLIMEVTQWKEEDFTAGGWRSRCSSCGVKEKE